MIAKAQTMVKTKPKDPDEYYDRREKRADEVFCSSCSAIAKKSSTICPKCSSPFANVSRKDKSTSILLALFTSFFVWLYLYEKNAIKFWIGLCFTVFGFMLPNFSWLSDQYRFIVLLPIMAIWLFAIIDVSLKDSNYYNS